MGRSLQLIFRTPINHVESFRLKLFGGAVLEGENGVLRGRAAHRRRIALLALLAAGRGRTVARERLIAMLWPENDGEAARHLLSESLYVLRKALGEGALVSAGDELGVDPERVACDVAAFEAAIASGGLETAVSLYAGPFLDGFYVSDAPEFERWAEEERSRFARAYAHALQTLAEGREAAGEWMTAVEWWRRLFAHDPFSSRVALRLMTALDAAGERAAALQVAAVHAARMQQELEAEPEPAVLSLAERLRTDPAPAGEPPARPASHLLVVPPPPLAATPMEGVEIAERAELGSRSGESDGETETAGTIARPAAEAAEAEARGGVDGAGRVRGRRRMVTLLAAAGAAAAALATAAVAWSALRPGEPATGITVAVFSFEAGDGRPAPAAAELQGLFSSAFTLVPGLWTVDPPPRAGARGWRGTPMDSLQAAARGRGARYFAIIEVVSTKPLQIVVSVREVVGRWDVVAREASAQGEPAHGAVQRIGLRLARAVAEREDIDVGPAARYLLTASDSAEALSHLMLASSSFRAGDAQTASREFRSAVAADPLCLLAYHRLSVVEGWSPAWNFQKALQAVDSGLAYRDQGRPIDVQLLEAQRELILRRGSAAVRRFTRLTLNDPTLVDGWFGKGEAVFHFEGMLGGTPLNALSAFEQVVRMDSTYSPAYEHLSEIAVRMNDRERARRYAERVRSPEEAAPYLLAVALRFGSGGERARALAALDTASRGTISNVVRIFTFDPRMVDTLGEVLMRHQELEHRQRGAGYRLMALTAQDRWTEALTLWQAVPTAEFDKWIVHAHLAGNQTPGAADMLRGAREFVVERGGPNFATRDPLTLDPFRALVHQAVLQGDSADVAFLLRHLEASALTAESWNPEPGALRATLRAREALLARDTAAAIRRLQEALERAPWWVSAYAPLADAAPERFLLAELLLARGRPREAERWLNSFGNIGAVGDLIYTRPVARLRARIRAADSSARNRAP